MKCSTCVHFINNESYTVCRFCHDTDKYEAFKKENNIENELIKDYEILVEKYEEAFKLYKAIFDEQEKTINLLKEKISLMEEIDELKDERIEDLTKVLMGIK